MSIAAHTHASTPQGGQLAQAALESGMISLAGTVSAAVYFAGPDNTGYTNIDIALTAYCLFPMIHTSHQTNVYIRGHSTDGGSADAPRFGLMNVSTTDETYDVDYRYLTA